MKVLLRRNVQNLGKISEVVEVKPGYARNYLLPQGLAVKPTAQNLKAVESEKAKYLEELAKIKSELEARAAVINGKEVAIQARANDEGMLYGSVGPAQIVAGLAAQNIFVEAAAIILSQPIRSVASYDVRVRLGEDVDAQIKVTVTALTEVLPDEDEDKSDEPDESGR